MLGRWEPCSPAPTCSQVKSDSSGLPEGNQWRYSEFIEVVQRGKVERVRFAKDGTQLQLTAVDGEQHQHTTAGRLCSIHEAEAWPTDGACLMQPRFEHPTPHLCRSACAGGPAQRP